MGRFQGETVVMGKNSQQHNNQQFMVRESMVRKFIFRESMLVGLLGAGLTATALTLGCSNAAQNPQAAGFQAMPVKVLEAKAVPVNDTSEYVATLKSRDSAIIMPQVEGQITQIFVHSGDKVEAGSALMEIDPLRQQASVKSQQSAQAALQANAIWTKQQYERNKELFAAGVVSKQDLDQAKAAMDSAQTQIDAGSAGE
jgi:multidrug efflux pump subunit AcrA (membrane-fusion protein)